MCLSTLDIWWAAIGEQTAWLIHCSGLLAVSRILVRCWCCLSLRFNLFFLNSLLLCSLSDSSGHLKVYAARGVLRASHQTPCAALRLRGHLCQGEWEIFPWEVISNWSDKRWMWLCLAPPHSWTGGWALGSVSIPEVISGGIATCDCGPWERCWKTVSSPYSCLCLLHTSCKCQGYRTAKRAAPSWVHVPSAPLYPSLESPLLSVFTLRKSTATVGSIAGHWGACRGQTPKRLPEGPWPLPPCWSHCSCIWPGTKSPSEWDIAHLLRRSALKGRGARG